PVGHDRSTGLRSLDGPGVSDWNFSREGPHPRFSSCFFRRRANMLKTHPNIMVTSQDFERIQQAMSRSLLDVDLLDQELERANLVNPQDIPPHVITMNSELIYEDLATGAQRQARLVYPVDANVDK